MPVPTADLQPIQSVTHDESLKLKPTVIGIYGIGGSGQTTFLGKLKEVLEEEQFTFYDGSAMRGATVPGGPKVFKAMSDIDRTSWTSAAITDIRKDSAEMGKIAIVAAHLMFWKEGSNAEEVWTHGNCDTYPHILFLEFNPTEIHAQRKKDEGISQRDTAFEYTSAMWQENKKSKLRSICRNHGILFSVLKGDTMSTENVTKLIRDFQVHTEEYNLRLAETRLDEIVGVDSPLQAMLVFDADKTLAPQDAGSLFCQEALNKREYGEYPMNTLFHSPLLYSYIAFRQAVLLFEEATNEVQFEDICKEVASAVKMHPEFISLLKLVGGEKEVGAVIITCGLRRVWEIVLENNGLSKIVKVIGGGRISDGFVVTAAVKGALVTRLRKKYHLHVSAFGGSGLDLEMLKNSHQAIVVVCDEKNRSGSMEGDLKKAIDEDGLQAFQALLPSNVSPRLDTTRLPLVDIKDQGKFLESISRCRMQVFLAKENVAKSLWTPIRDAEMAGPFLTRVGWYLATEFVTDVIGLVRCPIDRQVPGGYRLLDERKTTIVALRRGEPIANGVNDAFPFAEFRLAKDPEELKLDDLKEQKTVILVDSVIKSGKSMVKFVEKVLELQPTIRIVVVADVVGIGALRKGALSEALDGHTLIALRIALRK